MQELQECKAKERFKCKVCIIDVILSPLYFQMFKIHW